MTGNARSHGIVLRVVIAVEDAIHAVIVAVLRMVGRRRPMIIPFVGYGTGERARLGARVVLGRPAAEPATTPLANAPTSTAAAAMVSDTAPSAGGAGGGVRQRRRRRAVLRASLSRFFTAELPRATVTVRTGGGVTTVRADREGYLDAVVELSGLEPGWHELELSTGDFRTMTRLMVVHPEAGIGVVSDVDDTILETGLTRGLAFLRATLLTDVDERTPLPGAAALYRALVAGPAGSDNPGAVARPVFYVSTSPWNLHEMLLQFVELRGFPLGPLLLTDWGPGRGGLFRIGSREHKLTLIRRLLADHPRLNLVLIGDSGQVDPEIYAAVAREHPDRVVAVYIRLTASTPDNRGTEVAAIAAEVSALGVPMVAVRDSVEIGVHAASMGLLDPATLDGIRAQTATSA